MKYLPILACQLLTIMGVQAQAQPSRASTDSVFVGKNAGFRKTSSGKSGAAVVFERHQWDASVDASFVLPSFYTVNAPGYYGNLAYGYGGSNGNGFANYGSLSNGANTVLNSRSTRLMFRKNESVAGSARQGAYRAQLYLGGGYSQVSEDSVRFNGNVGSVNYYFPETNKSFSIGVGLGYEWQKQLGRFQLIYGYDVFARYGSNSNSGTVRDGRADLIVVSATNRSFSAGISPLAGVKFFIGSRFSLSFESIYSIAYYRGSAGFAGPVFGTVNRSFKEQGISYGLVPLSAINATFHFGRVNP